MIIDCTLKYIFVESRSYRSGFRCEAKNLSGEAVEKSKPEGIYIEKNLSGQVVEKSKREGLHIDKNLSIEAVEKRKHEGFYIDKDGKWRSFEPKKLSRKRCNTKL